ncbi:MAG: hypothetical protein ACFE9T_04690 [Promethearchaeota archaeon]
MKKINILIMLILISIGFFNITSFAKGAECYLIFLKTDKDFYYINEKIRINASWDLDYNTFIEDAYVQIQLFDNLEEIIWNSSMYDDIGIYEKNWTIDIEDLNLDFTKYTNSIIIKFFYYYCQGGGSPLGEFLKLIEINVVKRDVLCELIGFRSNMRYGQDLSFSVRFFDSLSGNSSNLINQVIFFEIFSNKSLTYQRNLTTNQMGIIEIFISSVNHLSFGQNILIFKIVDNKIYNNTEFLYEILLEKELLTIEIIEFKDTLRIKENLIIKLLLYYFSNDSILPLNDSSLILKIFHNNNLTFINEYKTDKSGILSINITQESFNPREKLEDLIINIIFNGNYFLENKTITLNLKIQSNTDLKRNIYSQISLFSLFLILFIISIAIFLTFRNIKRNKESILTEITFRY